MSMQYAKYKGMLVMQPMQAGWGSLLVHSM